MHGTQVNGKPVTSRLLDNNDLIDIGIYRFRFVQADVSEGGSRMLVTHQAEHLQLLLEVTRLINSSLNLKDVLEHVMDAVIRVTGADRGFLLTINNQGEVEFRIGRDLDRNALEIDDVTVSQTILERVRRSCSPIVMSDVLCSDAASRSPSVIDLGLRCVMCVPLTSEDRLTGLIYVDSQREARRFSEADLELFQSLASQASVAIEKSQLHEELQKYSASLEDQVKERTQELVAANDELKQAYKELQQAQARIVQAEKLASVGRLASGIAHEINSPLGVITSNIDTLAHLIRAVESGRIKQPTEMLQGIAGTSQIASSRLRRIMKAFESFSGLDQAEVKAVSVNEAIETVLTLLEHEVGNRIRIVKEFGEVKPVMCSPGGLHQALMNLLLNAIQAIDQQGEIYLRTEQQQSSTYISIRDTGRGMTTEHVARAFDPGFIKTGKRVGTGLGLLVTAQTIREAGGDIQLQSTLGSGTVVSVSFPLAGAERN